MKFVDHIRRIVNDKSNWPSLIVLALTLVSALVSFFMPDDRLSVKVLSVAVSLVTVEFFILIVVHLETIQNAIKSGRQKGAQIRKFEGTQQHQIIAEAKKELFFSGNVLIRLAGVQGRMLLDLPDSITVRILVFDIRNKKNYGDLLRILGGKASGNTLDHIDELSKKSNIDVRTVDFPQTIHIAAKDIDDDKDGRIEAGYFHYGSDGWDSPTVKLTPAVTEWYGFYKRQIETLWDKGKPWT